MIYSFIVFHINVPGNFKKDLGGASSRKIKEMDQWYQRKHTHRTMVCLFVSFCFKMPYTHERGRERERWGKFVCGMLHLAFPKEMNIGGGGSGVLLFFLARGVG